VIDLKNVTLVIPTYKRYPHLLRLLKFIFSYKTNIKILILDATPELPINDELIELLDKAQVKWKRYDESVTYWDRVADGSNMIITDYVVMCADDDFVFPIAIKESVIFLKENPEYISANGLYFSHPTLKIYSKYDFAISKQYKGTKSAEQPTAAERIDAFFSSQITSPRLYSVYRSHTFKLIWNQTVNYISDWGLAEIFPTALSYMLGKSKNLPIFYASRELNESGFFDYSLHKKFFSKDKIEKCVEGLSKYLRKIDNIEKTKSVEIIHNNIKKYLNNNKLNMSKNNFSNSLINKIRTRLNLGYRLKVLFYKGCDPLIYPQHFDDFLKLKNSVISHNLSNEELNKARVASRNKALQDNN